MSKEYTFLVFCIEIVKRARQLSGREVYKFFEQYDLITYIVDFYELLHVHGEKYILQDIDERIAELSQLRWLKKHGDRYRAFLKSRGQDG